MLFGPQNDLIHICATKFCYSLRKILVIQQNQTLVVPTKILLNNSEFSWYNNKICLHKYQKNLRTHIILIIFLRTKNVLKNRIHIQFKQKMKTYFGDKSTLNWRLKSLIRNVIKFRVNGGRIFFVSLEARRLLSYHLMVIKNLIFNLAKKRKVRILAIEL